MRINHIKQVNKFLLAIIVLVSDQDGTDINSTENSEQNLYFLHIIDNKIEGSSFNEMIFFHNSDYEFKTLPNYFVSYIEN